jgi:dihydroorotase
MASPASFDLPPCDDMHVHLRDIGCGLEEVIGDIASRFRRAVVMPNLTPPITTVAAALAYRSRIKDALATAIADAKANDAIDSQRVACMRQFTPLMTLYLTEATPLAEIDAVADNDDVVAFKCYPRGATTGSSSGVASLQSVYPQLRRMAERNVVLCVHGDVSTAAATSTGGNASADNVEVNGSGNENDGFAQGHPTDETAMFDDFFGDGNGGDDDCFDGERRFIDQQLRPALRAIPTLRVVMEHISTEYAAHVIGRRWNEDVAAGVRPRLAATITAHQLSMLLNSE